MFEREILEFAGLRFGMTYGKPVRLNFVSILAFIAFFVCSLLPLAAADNSKQKPIQPTLISLAPASASAGSSLRIEFRGKSLDEAYAIWTGEDLDLDGHITEMEAAPQEEAAGESDATGEEKGPVQRLIADVHIRQTAHAGEHFIRVVTPLGVSNPLAFVVNHEPTVEEIASPHADLDRAQPISIPTIVNSAISRPGELDLYAFQLSKEERLRFEVIATGNFDPQLTLYDLGGSWFEPKRLNRLAFSDDPVSEFTNPNPTLVYRFTKPGRYVVEVGAFLGDARPGSSYQLRITRADEKLAPLRPASRQWEEHTFRRVIGPQWIRAISSRTLEAGQDLERQIASTSGNLSNSAPSVPSDREPTSQPFTQALVKEHPGSRAKAVPLQLPALIEGTIDHPGVVDSYRFSAKTGQRLAFEIETPNTGLPLFNPRLAILDGDGHEISTNIYKRISRNFTFYLKTPEPKILYTFERAGDYYLEIRDITSRVGDGNCKYRLLVRSQLPHVGEARLLQDRINLKAGAAMKLTASVAQEEEFGGEIAFNAEGLPGGVTMLPGVDVKPDQGPSRDEGPKQRFVPKTEKVSLLLIAAADAPPTRVPQLVRISARPIVDGIPGPAIPVGELPVMVLRPAAQVVGAREALK